MKKLFFALLCLVSLNAFAQTGDLSGKLFDKENANEPLPFADIYIKGTTKGISADIEGNYTISNIEVGTYTIVFSFVGYETKEISGVVIKDGETTILNESLGAGAAALTEVLVTAVRSGVKESEKALLIQQKKAVVIKESIGAQELAKQGVSDAAAATTKISGVVISESSSKIYIRGLGDRYLSTTLNGLTIPSDDVENKNVNLNLFDTSIIQNVGISKTYSSNKFADQASGNIDVISKKYSKDFFTIGLSGGANTNVFGEYFRVSQNFSDNTLGFHSRNGSLKEAITNQQWDTKNKDFVGNFGLSLSGAKKINAFGNPLKIVGSISYTNQSEYEEGTFVEYTSNSIKSSHPFVQEFIVTDNLTGLFDLDYKISSKIKLSYTGLFINKTEDNVYEQGRTALGRARDRRPSDFQFTTTDNEDLGAFDRDQNIKQTQIIVNQLHGDHRLNDTNKIIWGLGYNIVNADEPNRIRNEVTILTPDTIVEIPGRAAFDQRKSSQFIDDNEVTSFLEYQLKIPSFGDKFKLNTGFSGRSKERNFESKFVGVAKGRDRVFVRSVDNLSSAFQQENFDNGLFSLDETNFETYDATLEAIGVYTNFNFEYNKFSGNVGFRYEADKIDLNFDVQNGAGFVSKNYDLYLPSLNIKYAITDNSAIRVAGSITATIPEFKEIAPFNYVNRNGRVITGNPDLEKSKNYNLDLKYELFPENGGLISVAGFYKQIKDPINLTLSKGSGDLFTFDNTGDKATAYGLELEGKYDIINNEKYGLNSKFNFTRLWTEQDLSPNFQFDGNTKNELQGASEYIVNGAISYTLKSENEFIATLAANYSSDKIAILGSSADLSTDRNSVVFNSNIVEKGFATLDFVLSKQLFEKMKLKLTAKNLIDPSIEETQEIFSRSQGLNEELVNSYKKGRSFSLSLNYTFR